LEPAALSVSLVHIWSTSRPTRHHRPPREIGPDVPQGPVRFRVQVPEAVQGDAHPGVPDPGSRPRWDRLRRRSTARPPCAVGHRYAAPPTRPPESPVATPACGSWQCAGVHRCRERTRSYPALPAGRPGAPGPGDRTTLRLRPNALKPSARPL
jgi:hypothetical protein